MRVLRSLVGAVVALVVLAAPAVVFADGRVALVVGNSAYAHIGRLPNPANDAADMSAALRRLGFQVTVALDADRVAFNDALRAFARRSAGTDVALVFYAGHGLEMDGSNYLVPVDARLERDVDVRYETVTLEDLLASTFGSSLRLVILDACRNNPLARSMQRTSATRSVSRGSFGELNEDLLGEETLVAYAAAAGTTAADGTGRNSPYTAALLGHLEQPLELGLLFRRVRAQVLEATNGEQRPHEYQSLVGEHFLLSGVPGAASVTVEAAAPPLAVAVAAPTVVDAPIVNVAELQVGPLRRLAEQGDPGAQKQLGERYEYGRGVGRDHGVAVSWYRRAADQGYAPAQTALGSMYRFGRGVDRDEEGAVSWYRRAAEQGDAHGENLLGVMYSLGGGVPRDRAEAVEWYRRAAEQGLLHAQRNLGHAYAAGRGVPEDDGEAASWYRRAVEGFRRDAEEGEAESQVQLGLMYRNGEGVAQDDGAAIAWFRQAAEQGSSPGQINLGWMYDRGRGVSRDPEQAFRWFRLAADQGNPIGQSNLGLMYRYGRGVRENHEEAALWFRRAADQENARAQWELGHAYLEGRGVRENHAEAVRWFRMAADQGYMYGQYYLGRMYQDGRGVRRDRVEAARWYRLAADQGHQDARKRLDDLR